jgi:hypothetical protein
MNFSLITLRRAGLFASLALVVGVDAATPVDLFPNYDSYIKLTGKTADVSGSPSAFARRLQIPDNGTWGIEALRVNRDLSDETALSIEGKALVGKEDYLGAVKLTRNEVGVFEVGYKRFRTFYDGIGGFFPLNNSWNQMVNPELRTDRAKFWAEAKIERPNAPSFLFRYTNEQRTGKKDTTIWGDTDFTGIPSYYGVGASALNPYSPNRKIVPAFINLDERQQIWLGSVKHTVGNTELELEVQRNDIKIGDRRSVVRYPGELQLFPRQSSSTNPPQVYPPATIGNQVLGYDKQIFDGTITRYTGKFETKFTDQVSVFGGVSATKIAADLGGDRQMTQYLPTAVGPVTAIGGFVGTTGRPPYSYTTVAGEINEKIAAANLGLLLRPSGDFKARFALKYEKSDIDGFNQTRYTSNQVNQTTGAITPVVATTPNLTERSQRTWLPEAELRYTPTKALALYANFEYRRAPLDDFSSGTGVGIAGVVSGPESSDENIKLNQKHYKVGANWTVNPMVSLRGELYYKEHTNGHFSKVEVGESFVLGYELTGTKLTATVKPLNNLSCTTRFLGQSGKMDTSIDGTANLQSNDTQTYQVGETIDWTPTPQSYVQVNANIVYNTIKTGYPLVGGLGNEVLRNADNNYRNGSFITGWILGKDTDASLQYTFYRADNYKAPTNATQWYGAGVKEYTVTCALKHRFTKDIVGQFKLGYVDSKNQTTGGNTNFKGPLAYVSFDYAI